MTDQQLELEIIKKPGLLRALWRVFAGTHFLAALAILVLTAGGWQVAKNALKLVTEKLPVPWPAGVEVNDKYVMTSMPDKIGPFEFVSADGELDYDPKKQGFRKDGRPDGEGEVLPDVMELLGIGTATDGRNLPLRRSNWLAVRTYRDSRRAPGDPLRYWRLEVYYYTGGVDLVPHVGEICIVAGGGEIISSTGMPFAVDGAGALWGDSKFRRVLFQNREGNEFVQYYIFSLNGLPRNDRNEVRLALGSLFVKHAYFAKVQFAPLPAVQQQAGRLVYAVPDPAQADQAAADFVKYFMPHVLKTLPMPKDIDRLNAGAGSEKAGS